MLAVELGVLIELAVELGKLIELDGDLLDSKAPDNCLERVDPGNVRGLYRDHPSSMVSSCRYQSTVKEMVSLS